MILENTRGALFQIKKDIKKYLFIFTLTTQLLYIAYLIAALVVPVGSRYISGATLAVCAAYLVFFIVTERKDAIARMTRRRVKRAYKWTKLAIKAVSLANTVYGIIITMQSVATTSTVVLLIIQAFTLILWVIQAIFELLKVFVIAEIDMLSEAFARDAEAIKRPIEAVKHPIKTAGGFLGRIFGRDKGAEVGADDSSAEPSAESRRARRLDDAVADYKQYREERKQRRREEKREKRQAKRAEDTSSERSDTVHR